MILTKGGFKVEAAEIMSVQDENYRPIPGNGKLLHISVHRNDLIHQNKASANI